MKIRGEFIIRRVVEDIVAIPVGNTALEFNGMIMLNEVSKVIWDCLAQRSDISQIVTAVTDAFEVSPQEAREDILEFIRKLDEARLLEE